MKITIYYTQYFLEMSAKEDETVLIFNQCRFFFAQNENKKNLILHKIGKKDATF